jgi:23S rRNA (cytosine1962-C5)-methyltransferase
MTTPVVRLKPGRERSVLRRHPWVFSGAVADVQGAHSPGATVDVTDFAGAWVARGAYSPESQIRVRVWTWEQDEPVDGAFVASRLERAVARRRAIDPDGRTNAYRECTLSQTGSRA